VPEHGCPPQPAQETGAIHHVRDAFFERLEQGRVVARIVLQVRVLDQQDVARGRVQSGANRRALALFF